MISSRDHIKAHLEMLLPPHNSFHQREMYLELARKDSHGIYSSFLQISPEYDVNQIVQAVEKIIEPWQRERANVHVAPILRKSLPDGHRHAKKEHVADEVWVLFSDIDGVTWDQLEEIIKGLKIKPTLVIWSGHGAHLYWKLASPISPELAELIMRNLSREIAHADHTHNVNRLLRLAGTINWKDPDKPVLAEVVWDFSSHMAYVPEDFKEYMQSIQPTANTQASQAPATYQVDVQAVRDAIECDTDFLYLEERVKTLSPRMQRIIFDGVDPEGTPLTVDGKPDRSRMIQAAVTAMVGKGWTDREIGEVISCSAFGISERVHEILRKYGIKAAVRDIKQCIENAHEYISKEKAQLAQLAQQIQSTQQGQTANSGPTPNSLTIGPGCLSESDVEMMENEIDYFYTHHRANINRKDAKDLFHKLCKTIQAIDKKIKTLRESGETKKELLDTFERLSDKMEDLFRQWVPIFITFTELHKQFQNETLPRRFRSYVADILDAKNQIGFYKFHPFSQEEAQEEIYSVLDRFGNETSAYSNMRENCLSLLIAQSLTASGEFFREKEAIGKIYPAGLIYYRDAVGRVMHVQSPEFIQTMKSHCFIKDKTNKTYQHALDKIVNKHDEYVIANVGFVSRYKKETHAVYIDAGPGRMCKITANGVEFVEPGTDGIVILTTLPRWEFLPDHSGDYLDLLTQVSNDPDGNLDEQQTRYVIKTWIVANFLRGMTAHYPLLILIGEKGSGKSTLAANIVRWMLNDPTYSPSGAPREERDLGALCAREGILVFDNVEKKPKNWNFEDALARLYDRGQIRQRKLFTDTEEVLIKPDAFVALTAINPNWLRADVADRSIPVRVAPWKKRDGEDPQEHLENILSHRDEIFTEIVKGIQRLLRLLQTKPLKQFGNELRLDSYASIMNAWAEANEESIDMGRFWAAFRHQQVELNKNGANLADQIRDFFLHKHKEQHSETCIYKMTASELYKEMKKFYGDTSDFAMKCIDSNSLACKLRDNKDLLKNRGILVEKKDSSNCRAWLFNITGAVADSVEN